MSNQDNHSSNHSSHFDTSTHDLMPSTSSHGNLNEEMNNFNLEMRKSRMPLTSNARRDETTILLSIMSKYDFNQANNNKSLQVKKWTEVLDTFNKLNTQGNFCKQTRTLKSRYEKLVALFLQNDLKTLKRLMHEKDIPLLQDIINNNNNSNNIHNNIDFNREMNSRTVKSNKTRNKKEVNSNIEETHKSKEHYGDDDEDEDEDLPLDSITVLPRSSYLSKREADAQAAASTESASPTTTNTSHSYISPNNNNNNNNKRLSLLYGAAMMEEENNNIHASPMSNSTNSTTRLYNASRDLEIQQLRESIVDIKNNILNLEKIFDRLNKKVDDLVKNDETFKDKK